MKFLTPPLHPWLLSLIAALIVPAMEAGAFDVRVRSTTLMEGRDKPAIILVPDDRVNSISMRLQRDDGAAVSRSGGPFNAGQEVVWEWSQPVGRQSYTGTLTVVYGDGQEGSMSPQFTIEVLGALKVEVPREQVNMDAHTLEVLMDRPAGAVELVVLADTGATIYEGSVPFSGEAPGTPLKAGWSQSPEDTVIRIDVKGYDTHEFWGGVELSPWSVEIPHEELVFDTGSSAVRGDQVPKLDATYTLIDEAVQKYGHLVKINLYVAGYTDTQGSNSSNMTLSRSRARSIAADLKRRGFPGSVFYQGFGEEVLAVATPDDFDEEANRRAAYILSAEMPPISGGIPAQDWTEL